MSGQFIDGGIFRLLGPVRLDLSGQVVELGPGKQRCLAASLLLAPAQPVPVDELVDRIWGARPPDRARNVLATYAARLRRILEPVGAPALRYSSGGYLLDCGADRTDLHQARALVAQARTADAPGEVELLLRRAAGHWRATPVAGLAGDWADRLRESLRREQIDVVTRWADAAIAAGRYRDVIEELRRLVAAEPTAEEPAGRLIGALAAAGRNAEAVQQYLTLHTALEATLGVSPSAELRKLYLTLVRDAAEAGTTPDPAEAAPPCPTPDPPPAQLPPGCPTFVGRRSGLAQLDGVRRDASAKSRPALAVVTGTAGVGKTSLVVHWAHANRDRFPDGQLFVNLRGFSSTAPVPPVAALRSFLRALGLAPAGIPADPDEAAALFRSRVDGRRLLVVLDNATSPEQVRPLLPGSPGCLTVVTSRNRLSGLIAIDGAHPVALDLLDDAESLEVLRRRLGAARLASNPAASMEFVRRSAGLPLALVIVAARVVARPTFALPSFIAELRDADDGLRAFTSGDPASDIHRVLSWSYRKLRPPAARMFRLLGLAVAADVGVATAASLAGVRPEQAREALAELCEAHLATEPRPGRFVLHDLLRAYARQLITDHEDETARALAVRRMIDHYVHSEFHAAVNLHAYRHRLDPPDAVAGVSIDDVAGEESALAWFATEHDALLAIVEMCGAPGMDRRLCQLVWGLSTFQNHYGLWREAADMQRRAVAAARRLGDPMLDATMATLLGHAMLQLGQPDDAYRHFSDALQIHRNRGDATGEGDLHFKLTTILDDQGRYSEALAHARLALDRFRAGGHRAGEGHALNAIGWCGARLHRYREALDACQGSLAISRELGDRAGQAHVLDSLGLIHGKLNQVDEAAACFREAIALFRAFGDRFHEADSLEHLGDLHHQLRSAATATAAWRAALRILDPMQHAGADILRAKLNSSSSPPPSEEPR